MKTSFFVPQEGNWTTYLIFSFQASHEILLFSHSNSSSHRYNTFLLRLLLKSLIKRNTDQKYAKHQHIQWPKALNGKTLVSATHFCRTSATTLKFSMWYLWLSLNLGYAFPEIKGLGKSGKKKKKPTEDHKKIKKGSGLAQIWRKARG